MDQARRGVDDDTIAGPPDTRAEINLFHIARVVALIKEPDLLQHADTERECGARGIGHIHQRGILPMVLLSLAQMERCATWLLQTSAGMQDRDAVRRIDQTANGADSWIVEWGNNRLVPAV